MRLIEYFSKFTTSRYGNKTSVDCRINMYQTGPFYHNRTESVPFSNLASIAYLVSHLGRILHTNNLITLLGQIRTFPTSVVIDSRVLLEFLTSAHKWRNCPPKCLLIDSPKWRSCATTCATSISLVEYRTTRPRVDNQPDARLSTLPARQTIPFDRPVETLRSTSVAFIRLTRLI